MEEPKKKSYWQVLGRFALLEAAVLANMYIIDYIKKVEFRWSELATRLISMMIVILLLSFLTYKLQKE